MRPSTRGLSPQPHSGRHASGPARDFTSLAPTSRAFTPALRFERVVLLVLGSTEIIRFENGFHDHIITQRLCSGHRTLVGSDQALVNDTWYTGPGILLSRMEGQHPSVIMICNTPVEDGEVRVWYALAVRVSDKAADDAGVALARAYQDTALEAFAQDFELWKYKEPAISILQVAGDGPFHKERIWHRQFYNPRERAGEFQRRVNGAHISLGAAKDFAAEAAE